MQVNLISTAPSAPHAILHWPYGVFQAGMAGPVKSIARAHAKKQIYGFAICSCFPLNSDEENDMASRGRDKLLADIPSGRLKEAAPRASIHGCAPQAPPFKASAVRAVNGASYVR